MSPLDLAAAARLLGHRVHRVVAAASDPYGRRALRNGVAPGVSARALLRRLDPTFVVDVGANRGQFALDVVAAAPRATVLSIEPIDAEADRFERVLGGHPAVRLLRCAVGVEPGRTTLYVAGAADSSSLLRPSALQAELFPGTGAVGTIEVEVRTLSSVLPSTPLPPGSLLKADVQGYELEVLRSAGERLREFRWVYVEVSMVELYEGQPLSDEVIGFAAASGFRLADVLVPIRRGGRAIQVDLLFEREDAIGRRPPAAISTCPSD